MQKLILSFFMASTLASQACLANEEVKTLFNQGSDANQLAEKQMAEHKTRLKSLRALIVHLEETFQAMPTYTAGDVGLDMLGGAFIANTVDYHQAMKGPDTKAQLKAAGSLGVLRLIIGLVAINSSNYQELLSLDTGVNDAIAKLDILIYNSSNSEDTSSYQSTRKNLVAIKEGLASMDRSGLEDIGNGYFIANLLGFLFIRNPVLAENINQAFTGAIVLTNVVQQINETTRDEMLAPLKTIKDSLDAQIKVLEK